MVDAVGGHSADKTPHIATASFSSAPHRIPQMSYTITVRVFQTNPNSGAYFRIVEQTTFRSGDGKNEWNLIQGAPTISFGFSGSSGALRFKSDKTNEPFIVVLGVHNYKRWCDIVTDPTPLQTAMAINEEYYGGGGRDRCRERQNASCNTTNSRGRKITVNYSVADGNCLVADVIVG
ncbi:XCL-like lectin [Mycena venus]|uniref:XCL-like lectin n=1 Tax=Mycena venus TaxID=2733690 RepID=A0A8H7CRW2_9AGAR|nr:XCL-like lectin [Mycena venus]